MDSDDEAFEEFIEYDSTVSDSEVVEEPDSNKENSAQSEGAKSKPTKKEQIEKIIAFVKENNEQLIEKSAYDLLWNGLTADINRLGPPEYTSDKWKRVWSQYKYRNKTRLTERFSSSLQNKPPHTDSKRQKLSSDPITIQTENCLSSQMKEILKQQKNIMTAIVAQGVTIQRNNELLEELSNKMS